MLREVISLVEAHKDVNDVGDKEADNERGSRTDDLTDEPHKRTPVVYGEIQYKYRRGDLKTGFEAYFHFYISVFLSRMGLSLTEQ